MNQSNQKPSAPLFDVGRIVATPGALEAMEEHGIQSLSLLQRHRHGDWGTLPAEDAKLNDQAVHNGSRILSSYTLSGTQHIWIITEVDRSITTFLLPEEY